MTSVSATETSAGATTQPQPRLVRAAHEFEAQMMQELMKPLTRGSSLTGEDEDSGADHGADDHRGHDRQDEDQRRHR